MDFQQGHPSCAWLQRAGRGARDTISVLLFSNRKIEYECAILIEQGANEIFKRLVGRIVEAGIRDYRLSDVVITVTLGIESNNEALFKALVQPFAADTRSGIDGNDIRRTVVLRECFQRQKSANHFLLLLRRDRCFVPEQYYVPNHSGLVVRRREALNADSSELLFELFFVRTGLGILWGGARASAGGLGHQGNED